MFLLSSIEHVHSVTMSFLMPSSCCECSLSFLFQILPIFQVSARISSPPRNFLYVFLEKIIILHYFSVPLVSSSRLGLLPQSCSMVPIRLQACQLSHPSSRQEREMQRAWGTSVPVETVPFKQLCQKSRPKTTIRLASLVTLTCKGIIFR